MTAAVASFLPFAGINVLFLLWPGAAVRVALIAACR